MLFVKKFGGTSVGSAEKIKRIAKQLSQERTDENKMIIVVSAMGKTTDELVYLSKKITNNPAPREMDVLLSTGERITMALLSMALKEVGVESISLTGSQCEIITSTAHGNARIVKIKATRVKKALNQNKVVIVAGFQGVSTQKEITTLGRGGSDTTAVALASALSADKCEIFTNVDGVYSADPRVVEDAKLIRQIDHKQMVRMAYSGSQVMHSRAIEIAQNYGLTLEVKSSVTFGDGTIIGGDIEMENKKVTSIVSKENLLYCKFIATLDEISILFQRLGFQGIEIFEYELLDDELSLVFDKKYKYQIDSTLLEMKFSNRENKNVKSVSLIGQAISYNLNFVAKILQIVKEYKTISVNRGDRDVTIILEEEANSKKLSKQLHKRFIK